MIACTVTCMKDRTSFWILKSASVQMLADALDCTAFLCAAANKYCVVPHVVTATWSDQQLAPKYTQHGSMPDSTRPFCHSDPKLQPFAVVQKQNAAAKTSPDLNQTSTCTAGFSQGSAVTLLLLAELAAHAPHLLPQFCILVRPWLLRQLRPSWLEAQLRQAGDAGAANTEASLLAMACVAVPPANAPSATCPVSLSLQQQSPAPVHRS